MTRIRLAALDTHIEGKTKYTNQPRIRLFVQISQRDYQLWRDRRTYNQTSAGGGDFYTSIDPATGLVDFFYDSGKKGAQGGIGGEFRIRNDMGLFSRNMGGLWSSNAHAVAANTGIHSIPATLMIEEHPHDSGYSVHFSIAELMRAIEFAKNDPQWAEKLQLHKKDFACNRYSETGGMVLLEDLMVAYHVDEWILWPEFEEKPEWKRQGSYFVLNSELSKDQIS